jgi:DNA-binding FadR family transcriptional regulator
MIKNLHGNALDWLGAAVVAGEFAVASGLPPEPALCAQLGVSRTVVREAVKSLVAKGLISTGPKVGTRVLPRDRWNWFDPDVITWQSRAGLNAEFLRDLQELRRLIEPPAVRFAAERASAAEVQAIADAYADMERAIEEGGDYVAADLRFHQGLLHACHNRMLVQMNKALSALLRTSFEVSTAIEGGPKRSLPMHLAVLEAVKAGRGDKAERAMLALITSAESDIDQVLSSRKRVLKITEPAKLLKPSKSSPRGA